MSNMKIFTKWRQRKSQILQHTVKVELEVDSSIQFHGVDRHDTSTTPQSFAWQQSDIRCDHSRSLHGSKLLNECYPHSAFLSIGTLGEEIVCKVEAEYTNDGFNFNFHSIQAPKNNVKCECYERFEVDEHDKHSLHCHRHTQCSKEFQKDNAVIENQNSLENGSFGNVNRYNGLYTTAPCCQGHYNRMAHCTEKAQYPTNKMGQRNSLIQESDEFTDDETSFDDIHGKEMSCSCSCNDIHEGIANLPEHIVLNQQQFASDATVATSPYHGLVIDTPSASDGAHESQTASPYDYSYHRDLTSGSPPIQWVNTSGICDKDISREIKSNRSRFCKERMNSKDQHQCCKSVFSCTDSATGFNIPTGRVKKNVGSICKCHMRVGPQVTSQVNGAIKVTQRVLDKVVESSCMDEKKADSPIRKVSFSVSAETRATSGKYITELVTSDRKVTTCSQKSANSCSYSQLSPEQASRNRSGLQDIQSRLSESPHEILFGSRKSSMDSLPSFSSLSSSSFGASSTTSNEMKEQVHMDGSFNICRNAKAYSSANGDGHSGGDDKNKENSNIDYEMATLTCLKIISNSHYLDLKRLIVCVTPTYLSKLLLKRLRSPAMRRPVTDPLDAIHQKKFHKFLRMFRMKHKVCRDVGILKRELGLPGVSNDTETDCDVFGNSDKDHISDKEEQAAEEEDEEMEQEEEIEEEEQDYEEMVNEPQHELAQSKTLYTSHTSVTEQDRPHCENWIKTDDECK
ncbi:hypothetical protein KP509_14G033700 [Ceratopteris richardii]|uniref:Uncharacterized protein n=1 Tax=Ceratopteris richardii TaxID=49495 RepID=A0A8T2TDR9_CERRI|nr:hypothetical protein KP509_14G033700 [Ceratopteris richardii]